MQNATRVTRMFEDRSRAVGRGCHRGLAWLVKV
jgi:hypothetical protein